MKNVFVSILAAIYLCSSTGATVHLHYCMGKLVNWSLEDKDNDQCDKCGMQKDGNCCKDENKFVKSNIDQKTAESAFQLVQVTTCIAPAAYTILSEIYFSSLIENYPISHAPPLISGNDILIHNCVFRI